MSLHCLHKDNICINIAETSPHICTALFGKSYHFSDDWVNSVREWILGTALFDKMIKSTVSKIPTGLNDLISIIL